MNCVAVVKVGTYLALKVRAVVMSQAQSDSGDGEMNDENSVCYKSGSDTENGEEIKR